MTAAAYTVLFYVLAAFAVLLAIGVTNAPRLLRAAVYLMGVLMMSAGMYVLLGAEFLAGIQVLVYVGGIVVLIVFAVMLTRSAELQVDYPSPKRKFLAAVASIAFLIFTAAVFWTTQFPTASQGSAPGSDVLAIGKALLAALPEKELEALRKHIPLEPLTKNTHVDWEKLKLELNSVRETRLAFDQEENLMGLCSIAVALQDPKGEMAAVSVLVPTRRFKANKDELARLLVNGCQSFQKRL